MIAIFYKAFLFKTEKMQKVFSAYPELVCVDATYKLLELRFPLYVMMVEDGNGQSEIAAIFLLVEETESSILCMVNSFIPIGNLLGLLWQTRT